MANKKNLANAELNADITAAATSFAVKAGQGARLPAVPFFATITPLGVLSTPDNSEIVSVTGLSTDTLTVTRAQKGTTAKSFLAGAIIANGIYTDDVDIAGNIDAATSKTTPVDADELALADSASSFSLAKLTWANLKAAIKSYYDSVTSTLTNKTLTDPQISGSASAPSTPSTGFGKISGAGTGAVRPKWINSSGTLETIYTDKNNEIYSTSETDTGKKWVDGSTIYRKVVNTTFNAVASNSISIPHGISGLSSTCKFISITGGFAIGNTSDQTQQNLNYHESSGNYMKLVAFNTTYLNVCCSFNWGTSRIIAIVEYVK